MWPHCWWVPMGLKWGQEEGGAITGTWKSRKLAETPAWQKLSKYLVEGAASLPGPERRKQGDKSQDTPPDSELLPMHPTHTVLPSQKPWGQGDFGVVCTGWLPWVLCIAKKSEEYIQKSKWNSKHIHFLAYLPEFISVMTCAGNLRNFLLRSDVESEI